MNTVYNLKMTARARGKVSINRDPSAKDSPVMGKGEAAFVLTSNSQEFEEALKPANHAHLLYRNFKYIYTPKLHNIKYRGVNIKHRFTDDELTVDVDGYYNVHVSSYTREYNTIINTCKQNELLLSKKKFDIDSSSFHKNQ